MQTDAATWRTRLPYRVECHASIYDESRGTVYIIGGWDGVNRLDSVIKYDLATNQCTILPGKLGGFALK